MGKLLDMDQVHPVPAKYEYILVSVSILTLHLKLFIEWTVFSRRFLYVWLEEC